MAAMAAVDIRGRPAAGAGSGLGARPAAPGPCRGTAFRRAAAGGGRCGAVTVLRPGWAEKLPKKRLAFFPVLRAAWEKQASSW